MIRFKWYSALFLDFLSRKLLQSLQLPLYIPLLRCNNFPLYILVVSVEVLRIIRLIQFGYKFTNNKT